MYLMRSLNILRVYKSKIVTLRFYITQENTKWKSVVGLEIHAQINTKSKLFSGSANDVTAPVNTCVSLFDAATPGTLPVLNRRCVELAVITSLALNCTVNEVSMFDRKHYFYADLPTGYQITQQRSPIANNGFLEFRVYTPGVHQKAYRKKSIIKQIQLEQDSGKSLHDSAENQSFVDLNRAGVPLMELVFQPDLEDGEEAAALVKEIILIMRLLDASTGKLEAGALRVDANVSVHKEGEPLGVRTEIKNIGSVRGVANAIKHEIKRQITLKESGRPVVNQTRAWDVGTNTTIAMRDKEVVQDYRYMPEPNLPPLRLSFSKNSSSLISVPKLKSTIPELPERTRQRLIKDYDLRPEYAIQIVNESILLNYFEDLIKKPNRIAQKVGNILVYELLTALNKNEIQLVDCKLPSESIGGLIDLLQNKQINIPIAQKVFDVMLTTDKDNPIDIVSERNWFMISDDEEIKKICMKVIEENEEIAAKYKKGKKKVLFQALVRRVAKATELRANMSIVLKIMEELLSK